MQKYKPVVISKASFAFCRFSIAVLVWLAFLLSSKIILAIICAIFLFSAILKVERAPMIWLYDQTIQRLYMRKEVVVNQDAIFFAHLAGMTLSAICLSAVTIFQTPAAWYVVLGFAILKTVSALGFCPATKLYDCTMNGNCCVNKGK